MKVSRRVLLAGLGSLVVGGLVNNGVHKNALAANPPNSAKSKRFEQMGGDFSWKPHKLDLDEVLSVGHAGFHHKGYG